MAETDQDAFLSRRVGARAVDHRPPDVGRLELDSSSLSHFIQAASRATSERGKLVDLADHFSAIVDLGLVVSLQHPSQWAPIPSMAATAISGLMVQA